MLIAESTLQAPLQAEPDMMDVREEEDLKLLSGNPSQDGAHPTPSSSTASASLRAEESQGEPLALEEGEGGKSGRRRSVTFAEAPVMEGSWQGGQPKSPGLRKGFFGKPKPVLKRTSSISDDSSGKVDKLLPEDGGPHNSAVIMEAQSRLIDAQDAAFSGHVVERTAHPTTKKLITPSPNPSATGQDSEIGQTKVAPDEGKVPLPKVSRFKQQRQKPVCL